MRLFKFASRTYTGRFTSACNYSSRGIDGPSEVIRILCPHSSRSLGAPHVVCLSLASGSPGGVPRQAFSTSYVKAPRLRASEQTSESSSPVLLNKHLGIKRAILTCNSNGLKNSGGRRRFCHPSFMDGFPVCEFSRKTQACTGSGNQRCVCSFRPLVANTRSTLQRKNKGLLASFPPPWPRNGGWEPGLGSSGPTH